MRHLVFLFAALSFAALCTTSVIVHAQIGPPNTLNFQGRLATPSGNPVPDGTYNLRLRIYDAATAGNTLIDQSLTNIPVRNGTFAVQLTGIKAENFDGNTWLGISINGAADLSPRQQIVTVPYAFKANLALTVPNESITNAKIAPGTLTADRFASGVLNTTAWLLGGNSGVTSGFLGTTDAQPMEMRVSGRRAMRYQYAEEISNPNTNFQYRSINVLGGSEINTINAGVIGATIAGGGLDYLTGTDFPNTVTRDFGTIGGGLGNTASRERATVGGGLGNTASGPAAAVGGGVFNTASGNSATIAGGNGNTASQDYATVGGGYFNTASGNFSMAAGGQAKANHDGTFVWKSYNGNDFASTANNQFLISASGGVGINTNDPAGYALHVAGTGKFDGNLTINGTTYTSDARYKKNIAELIDPLDALLSLRGVSYQWDKVKFPNQNLGEGKQIGFIAQELETVFPELVKTDAKGYKSINYIGIIPVTVEAIKALKKDNDAKQKQIDTLKADLDTVMQRLEAMEKQNARR